MSEPTVSTPLSQLYTAARQLAPVQRLMLARWLLDSVLDSEPAADTDWTAMSLAAFEQDWDNSEDAIYDRWQEIYGLPAR